MLHPCPLLGAVLIFAPTNLSSPHPPLYVQECPEGTYTEMTGSTSQAACVPAPAGNYAAGTGNDGFTPCEPGTYQDQPGKASCKDCPPGYACPAGSVNPIPCSKGFYADLKQPWCKECAKGTYQDQTAQRACKPCPAGAYCAATKMVAPTPCPAGRFGIKFSSVTANDCAKCPINVSLSRGLVAQLEASLPCTAAWLDFLRRHRPSSLDAGLLPCLRREPLHHQASASPFPTTPHLNLVCRPSLPAPAPPPAPSAPPASGPAASTARPSAGPPPSACREQGSTQLQPSLVHAALLHAASAPAATLQFPCVLPFSSCSPTLPEIKSALFVACIPF